MLEIKVLSSFLKMNNSCFIFILDIWYTTDYTVRENILRFG